MPVPRAFRRVAAFLNPAVRPLARRMPPLATLRHQGRKSGRTYETPVMAFPTGSGWLIALAYGADVQWLRNVEHTGRATLSRRGERYQVTSIRRVDAAAGSSLLPPWARAVMGTANVSDYVILRG